MESENVIVRRGGTSFQIEVNAESRDSYELEDTTHKITERYQEREITLRRKEELGADAVYSPTITITVPKSTKNVLNSIITTTGDISIDHSHADMILAVTEMGNITISDSFATNHITAESVGGKVSFNYDGICLRRLQGNL